MLLSPDVNLTRYTVNQRPAVIVKQQTSAPVDALQRPVSGTTNGGRKNSKGLSIQTGHSGDANAEQHVVQVQPASATGARMLGMR